MSHPPAISEITTPAAEPPFAVIDVDVADLLPSVEALDDKGRRRTEAWVTVRAFTEPLAQVIVPIPASGIPPQELAAALTAAAGDVIEARLTEAHIAWKGKVPIVGVIPQRTPPFLNSRAKVLANAPAITAVVCTRGRPLGLRRCLESLSAQQYPDFEVLIVDNAPIDDTNRVIVAGLSGTCTMRYVVEPRPGLSWARNCSVELAGSDIIAWLDDDEVADPHWLAEIARAYFDHPAAGAVAGLVLPAEVETPAQGWFEQYGGHSKGRGFRAAVFSPATAHVQSPLYPLPCFGTGANMSFRKDAIESIGRFDLALGAGTRSLAGEDTLAFSEYLYQGGTMVYQPSALTRHYHRRNLPELEHQFLGLGSGLSAFYTSIIARHPRVLFDLARLVGRASHDLIHPGQTRLAGIGRDFPRSLLRARRRGLASGPFMYLRARRTVRSVPDLSTSRMVIRAADSSS